MAATAPKPAQGELGGTGTQISPFSRDGAGFVTELDYNSDLIAPLSYDVYDKMRKGDGQVKAALNCIKLPLLNAEWSLEPASDSPLDRMIAETLEEDLFGGMNVSWSTWFRQMLLHLDYGVMPFEKVWRLDDSGLIRLRKLASRHPRTVYQWLVNAQGGLAGIRQIAPPFFMLVDIPVDKLLVFTNDLEGSDYRGTSILRAAYKHWFIKDKLYIVQGIAIEKRATGIDVGTLSGEAINDAHKQAMERALMTLTAHQRQFFIEVEGQTKYRTDLPRGTFMDPQGAIEHHDLRILRALMAEFIALGAGALGSQALSRDKTSYFLLALGGIADTICDTVNSHLIQQWVDYNWLGAAYPRLRYSRLEQRDITSFADAIQKLTAAGALTPDMSVEEESRDMLSLPDLTGPRAEDETSNPGEAPESDLEDMPTEQVLAAQRALKAVLRRRKAAAESRERATYA
jgi:hypothetical protein